jgi:hypothetical protein
VLSEHGSVRAADDYIHHILDRHETFDELLESVAIFRHEACILEVSIVYDTGEENRSQLLEVGSHLLLPLFDVVPAQARTGDNENEAEKYYELCAQTEEPVRG